jgi:hypothetical protein
MGELDVSQRKACQIVGISRTTLRRPLAATSAADPDAAFRQHLREYAAKHPRWGYRRAHHDAVNSGWRVNHKKTQRIWREASTPHTAGGVHHGPGPGGASESSVGHRFPVRHHR